MKSRDLGQNVGFCAKTLYTRNSIDRFFPVDYFLNACGLHPFVVR